MDTITTIPGLLTLNGSVRPVMVDITQNEKSLIAACPDMLEALRDLVKQTTEYINDRREDIPYVTQARAAIAKAEGR